MIATDTPTTDTASTYGWDTVFGIHIADANAAIIKAGKSPKTFQTVDTPDGMSVAGTFGPWQVTTGGSGDLIMLLVPIATATVTSGQKVYPVTKASATVLVRLNFLAQVDPTGKTSHNLLVQTTAPSPDLQVATVSPITYQDGQQLPFLEDAGLQALLQLWMNENLDQFDHVFASVDLDRQADTGAFQWMQPTSTSYAYSEISPSDGLLVILNQTEKRSPDGLIQQASSKLVPDGQRAGLLISKQRLMSEFIYPAMLKVFPGTVQSDFTLSSTGESITNAHQGIQFTASTKDHGSYQAQVQELVVTIDATELQMNVLTVTEVSPGIQAFCRTQNFLTIQLVNKSDGTQTLTFVNARPAIQNNWTQTSPGIQIAEDILAVIAAIVAAIAIVVSGGTALVVIVMIVGLAAGLMALTTDIIQDVGQNDGPAIDSLVLNASAAITWPDSKGFKLAYAGLNDSLVLAGDPQFD
jgi:hypothetical protein